MNSTILLPLKHNERKKAIYIQLRISQNIFKGNDCFTLYNDRLKDIKLFFQKFLCFLFKILFMSRERLFLSHFIVKLKYQNTDKII